MGDNKEKVIVLGNGFDLASGLPTSYKHYFIFRFTSIENQMKILSKYLSSDGQPLEQTVQTVFTKNINFWDVYFWYLCKYTKGNNDLDWNNVEEHIRLFINDENNSSDITLENINKYNNLDAVQSKTDEEFITEKHEKTKFQRLLNLLLNGYLLITYDFKKQTIYDMLLSELEKFETNFREYVHKIMSEVVSHPQGNQTSYRNNLLTVAGSGHANMLHLLNFNYTSIASVYNRETKKAVSKEKMPIQRGGVKYTVTETNVHGRYDSIAIFGIDQSKISANEPKYMFSKTFRKISAQTAIVTRPIPLPSVVDELIFYGHSLSEADYSYFQSLFDYFDIYHNPIRLSFKYSVYGDESGYSNIKLSELTKITKLLEQYGESMDNKVHGKNLSHKLLLEDRLKVEQLTFEELECTSFYKGFLKHKEVLDYIGFD